MCYFSQSKSRIQEIHLSYGFVSLNVEAQNLCRLPSATYVSFGVELEAVPDSRTLRETPRDPKAQMNVACGATECSGVAKTPPESSKALLCSSLCEE